MHMQQMILAGLGHIGQVSISIFILSFMDYTGFPLRQKDNGQNMQIKIL